MTVMSGRSTAPRGWALPAWLLGLLVGAYVLLFLNHSLWQQVGQSFAASGGPWRQLPFAATVVLRLLGVEAIIIAAVLWPRWGKPLLIVLLLVSAASAYYMDTFGAWLNQEVIQSIFETSPAEARGLLTAAALGWFSLFGLLPAALVAWVPVRFAPWRRGLRWRAGMVLVLLVLMQLSSSLAGRTYVYYQRNHRSMYDVFNPYAALSGTFHYLQREVFHRRRPLQPYGDDAKLGAAATAADHKRIFVLVVGETARAENQSLQGYARDTNPRMRERGVYYFRDTWSCGTATTVSVPCMFSGMGREHFDKPLAQARWNLLDILQHAGVDVAWRDNDEGCKGVCARVPSEDLTAAKIDGLCDANGCLDDVLLADLPRRLAAMRSPALLVLHLKGSHGPAYYQRYPKAWRHFTPGCDTAELQTCDYAQVLNSYDNSILYTDHILDQVVGALAAQPANVDSAMLYLSDHGESLGENHIYLHGMDWAKAPSQQKHVPMLLWLSPSWVAREPGLDACLRPLQAKPWSQDNLFHTVLGWFDVSSKVYQPGMDILSSCRSAG